MSKFKGVTDLVDAVQIVSNFSPDGQAATVLFRNVEASAAGKRKRGLWSARRS